MAAVGAAALEIQLVGEPGDLLVAGAEPGPRESSRCRPCPQRRPPRVFLRPRAPRAGARRALASPAVCFVVPSFVRFAILMVLLETGRQLDRRGAGPLPYCSPSLDVTTSGRASSRPGATPSRPDAHRVGPTPERRGRIRLDHFSSGDAEARKRVTVASLRTRACRGSSSSCAERVAMTRSSSWPGSCSLDWRSGSWIGTSRESPASRSVIPTIRHGRRGVRRSGGPARVARIAAEDRNGTDQPRWGQSGYMRRATMRWRSCGMSASVSSTCWFGTTAW